MTAAKVMELCRTSSRRSIYLHPDKNGGRSKDAFNSKVKMSRFMDTSSTTQVAQRHGQTLKIQWFFSNDICTETHLQTSCGRDSSKRSHWDLDGRRYRNGNVRLRIENKDHSCPHGPHAWMTSTWLERSRTWLRYGRHS